MPHTFHSGIAVGAIVGIVAYHIYCMKMGMPGAGQ